MRKFSILMALALATLTLPAPAARRAAAPGPFLPPPEFRAIMQSAGGARTAVGARPVIRGILVADGESLVNLNGQIIGVGEEANGYRLIEVGDEQAIFQHDGEIITLALYPDEDNDSNER